MAEFDDLIPGYFQPDLAKGRSRFADELTDPKVRMAFNQRVANEVGGQSEEEQQAFVESVMNRANARKQALRDVVNDQAYFPHQSFRSAGDADYTTYINRAIQGSNVSKRATGNESGRTRSGGAPITMRGTQGERFVVENPDTAFPFDDLIPGKQAAGEFDDLIPKGGEGPNAAPPSDVHPGMGPESLGQASQERQRYGEELTPDQRAAIQTSTRAPAFPEGAEGAREVEEAQYKAMHPQEFAPLSPDELVRQRIMAPNKEVPFNVAGPRPIEGPRPAEAEKPEDVIAQKLGFKQFGFTEEEAGKIAGPVARFSAILAGHPEAGEELRSLGIKKIQELGTPENLAIALAMSAGGPISAAAEIAFGTQGAEGAYDASKRFVEAKTPQEKNEALADLAMSTAMVLPVARPLMRDVLPKSPVRFKGRTYADIESQARAEAPSQQELVDQTNAALAAKEGRFQMMPTIQERRFTIPEERRAVMVPPRAEAPPEIAPPRETLAETIAKMREPEGGPPEAPKPPTTGDITRQVLDRRKELIAEGQQLGEQARVSQTINQRVHPDIERRIAEINQELNQPVIGQPEVAEPAVSPERTLPSEAARIRPPNLAERIRDLPPGASLAERVVAARGGPLELTGGGKYASKVAGPKKVGIRGEGGGVGKGTPFRPTGEAAEIRGETEGGLGRPAVQPGARPVPAAAEGVSVKNAAVEAARKARGLDPVLSIATKDPAWNRAEAELAKDPGISSRLVELYKDKTGAADDVVTNHLLRETIDRTAEYDAATEAVNKAVPGSLEHAAAHERFTIARERFNDVHRADRNAGTGTSEGFRARQALRKLDYTPAKVAARMQAAKGTPLKPRELAKAHAMAKRLEAKRQQLEAMEQKVEKMGLNGEGVKLKLKIKNNGGFVNVDILGEMVGFGKKVLGRGMPYARWAGEMVRYLGKQISKHLRTVWDSVTGRNIRPGFRERGGIGETGLAGRERPEEWTPTGRKYGSKAAAELQSALWNPKEGHSWEYENRVVKGPGGKGWTFETKKQPIPIEEPAAAGAQQAIDLGDPNVPMEHRGPTLALKLDDGTILYANDVRLHSQILDKSGVDPSRVVDSGIYKRLSKVFESKTPESVEIFPKPAAAGAQPKLSERIKQLRAEKGEAGAVGATGPIPKAEKAYQTRLKRGIKEGRKILEAPDRTQAIKELNEKKAKDKADREARVYSAETERLRGEHQAIKNEIDREIYKAEIQSKHWIEKTGRTLVKGSRAMLLTGGAIFPKLAAAGATRLGTRPLEGAVQSVIGQIPGLRRVHRAAPLSGLNLPAEIAAVKGAGRGVSQMIKRLKGEHAPEEELYGKPELEPRSWLDVPGQAHAAMKAPIQEAERARATSKLEKHYADKGEDINDPAVRQEIGTIANQEARRSIFMNDNVLSEAWKGLLRSMEQSKKFPLAGKTGAMVGKFLLPIVRVPTNIAIETGMHTPGIGQIAPTVKLIQVMRRGMDTIKPEEANMIMRHYSKGAIGAGLALTGYFMAANGQMSGFYEPGKKEEGEVSPMAIKMGGVEIPALLLHAPAFMVMAAGATFYKATHHRNAQGELDRSGPLRVAHGLVDEIPFVKEMGVVDAILGDSWAGEKARGGLLTRVIPQFVRETAKSTDPLEEPNYRAPKTAGQFFMRDIPGLRQKVRIKGPDLPREGIQP